jgi:acyl-CoA thioester hydrolase
MDIRYHRPIFYTTKPRIDIAYQFTPAAKIIFDYEIRDTKDNALLTSARTIQAFTDQQYQLILENPEFYLRWKRSHFNEDEITR